MTFHSSAGDKHKGGQQALEAARAKQEALERSIAAAKADCQGILQQMRKADPAQAEQLKKRLNDALNGYKMLSMDFRKSVMETARHYECFANMRAANSLLEAAMGMAMHHNTAERAKLLGKGREHYRKAMSLGADKEFAIAAERIIAAVTQTKAPDLTVPTKAKPVDTAPTNPHHAKN
ncbi:MAG: hypothetical protein HQL37_08865 [Alphaproteobacteria bacterium]|nr:hypothetical protein [Alphaproteobacteria bacterium]